LRTLLALGEIGRARGDVADRVGDTSTAGSHARTKSLLLQTFNTDRAAFGKTDWLPTKG
jgi:hypothetical protein